MMCWSVSCTEDLRELLFEKLGRGEFLLLIYDSLGFQGWLLYQYQISQTEWSGDLGSCGCQLPSTENVEDVVTFEL